MGKLPRNLSGRELAALLSRYGYEKERQTGSHIRLRTMINGEYSITIVDERPLNAKTLSRIIADVATHFGMAPSELRKKLFTK